MVTVNLSSAETRHGEEPDELLRRFVPASVFDTPMFERRYPSDGEPRPSSPEDGMILYGFKRYPKAAVALVGGRPTLCLYAHTLEYGRLSKMNYRVFADFVALDDIRGVEATGRGFEIVGRDRRFVRSALVHHQSSLTRRDPTTGADVAGWRDEDHLAGDGSRLAIPMDIWEPSLLSFLQAYVSQGGGGGTAGPDAGAPEVSRVDLAKDRDAIRQVDKMHERLWSQWDAPAEKRYMVMDVVESMLGHMVFACFRLSLLGLLLAWPLSLCIPDRILLLQIMLFMPLLTIVLFYAHMLIADLCSRWGSDVDETKQERLTETAVLRNGKACIVSEGTERYLCVADHTGCMQQEPAAARTAYHIVCLTDGSLACDYDEGTRVLRFHGGGIWETESLRRRALDEFVPSRDLGHCTPTEEFAIADCFTPSICEQLVGHDDRG